MKNILFLKRKFLKNITFVISIILISLNLILGSAISAIIPSDLKEEIHNEITQNYKKISSIKNEKINNEPLSSIDEDCPIMYGYCTTYPFEGIIKFYVCNCTIIDLSWNPTSGDFLSGGTYGCDGVWYVVQYGNGLLYGIDPFTGDMWNIGGGGQGMNGLAYDPITHKMYGSSDNDYLYEINPENGEQEQIGSFGGGAGYMIGMAFDADGILYGWDLIQDSLWTIDTETGEATKVGPLGINLNYAGDGDFHRESDTLYITAYSGSGGNGVYKLDKTTGEATLLCNLDVDITATIFLNECTIPEHDISIKSIDYPEDGYAIENVPMQVTVKNYGNNTEISDIVMKVINYEEVETIYYEDFSGSFPPEGWETDFWNKSNTNISGGTSPEAKVNKYDQQNEGQYYDNYISSAKINCSDFDKIKLRFRWAADYSYPQYSSVYVKVRSNPSSPWKDVTPWENPIGDNQPARVVDINCYGIYEKLGDEFQVKWEYIGYYYYYNNLWLDDFEIITFNNIEDYNETVEDIEVEKGEEIIVEFPEWTPTNWQDPDYEDIWVDYKINARTLLEDDRPNNDYKNKIVELYYPWVHDVELKCINSPCENGPGKTYPVDVTIKNVGQNAECCMPVYISIGESFVIDSMLIEDAWDTVPPEGWYDEHKEIGSEFGWNKSDTTKSGGESPEAYLQYQYARKDYVMYSYSINTINFPMVRLKFKTHIDHYSGQGLYSLEAGYSTDKETWHTVWHEEPGSNKNYDVDVPINESSETMYIGFWVKGDPYYFNKWYIDDIKLQSMGYEEEYYDYACQGPDIEPGEEVTLSFDDWTPNFLLEETTGTKEYIIGAEIELEGDKNPSNDIKNEIFTLEFFHDVGIDEIISPTGGNPERLDNLIYDNGDPDGFNGLFFGHYGGYDNWLIDDFEITQKTDITGVKFHFLWNAGYSSNCENVKICIVEETGTCNPDSGPAYYETETTDFVEYTTGNYYFSRPEVVIEADFEGVTIPAGKYWIGVCPDGIIDNSAYWLTASLKNCCIQFDNPYLGYSRWTPGSSLGHNNDLAWAVYGGNIVPKPRAWIQLGTEDIKSVVMNYGTFVYEDLTCYAQIREFITDPENGTELFNASIDNIDLDEPLGGSEALDFGSFTFADEGRYGLFMQLPADPDDVIKNNEVKYGIGVDDTDPFCDYPPIFDPPDPDGNNGWYVNPVTITINANDPFSNDVSSGVKEIRYSINNGPIFVIEGNSVTFIVDEEGEILIEYWAIDWVGNVESPKNSILINIDLSKPNITLNYEVVGGNKWQGWDFEFTASAYDNTSDIDYVEFYFNDELQEIITYPGPFVWTYRYYGGLDMIITAIAYDNAGHYNSDEIENPTKNTFSNPKTNKMHNEGYNLVNVPRLK